MGSRRKKSSGDEFDPIFDHNHKDAIAKPRVSKGKMSEDLRSLVKELSPIDAEPGLSEDRVKQLSLLIAHYEINEWTEEELEQYLYPQIYTIFLKGFTKEEMALAFNCSVRRISTWIDKIRKLSKTKLESYDAFDYVAKTFDQFDMLYKLSLEDYAINKGLSEGGKYLKQAHQVINDKMKWAFDLNLLDPVKNSAQQTVDDKTVKGKKLLDQSLDLMLEKLSDIPTDDTLMIEDESSNTNSGDKQEE